MKNEDLILMAMVGVGILVLPKLLGKKGGGGGVPASSTGGLQPWVYEVARADGWVYYSDGTSISPDGKYYKSSDLVYQPEGMYQ